MNAFARTAALAALFAAPPASALILEYVAVRDAGNEPDIFGQGDVAYDFAISRYEITNTQYVEFLNQVANEVDAHGLYDASMPGIDFPPVPMGFERLYMVEPGFERKPVVGVSFWDAVRFANWLHNGRPHGLQDSTTTEDGAYHLTQFLVDENLVLRNSSAAFFIPSDDEWFKAAYYDAAFGSFYSEPMAGVPASCAAPGPTPGAANCDGAVGMPTDVGSYPASPGPYGTLDQGGNAREWTETIVLAPERRVRGGAWNTNLASLGGTISNPVFPTTQLDSLGFRVAKTVPEPGPAALLGTGALVLAAVGKRRSG